MSKNEKIAAYKGFQILGSETKMKAKMHGYTLLVLFLVQAGLFLYLFNERFPESKAVFFLNYFLHWLLSKNEEWEIKAMVQVFFWAKRYFFLTLPVYLGYPLFLLTYFIKSKKAAEKRHVRGAKLIEVSELNKAIKKSGERTHLRLGEVGLPVTAEVKHVLCVGRPGSGKTVCLSGAISQIGADGGKGIIYDYKGDFLSHFYNSERDLIFNPLDSRSVNWNLFADIKSVMDVDSIAASLIPENPQVNDPFWTNTPRDLFAGILRYCIYSGRRTNADIWSVVCSPIEELSEMLKATPGAEAAAIHIADPKEKTAKTIHSSLMQYAKSFVYMKNDGDFSLSDWIVNGNPGFIFVTSSANNQEALRPVISLFIDMMSRQLLSLQDDLTRRLYIMLDELGTLQKLTSLVQLLTLARSKGGSAWLGIQDIGQIDAKYGNKLRQAIVNACSTSVMLPVNDEDTAKFLSGRLGEAEKSAVNESLSMGSADNRDGLNLARQNSVEKVLLYSEFLNMQNLIGVLKIPDYDAARISLKWQKYEKKHESLILRQDLSL